MTEPQNVVQAVAAVMAELPAVGKEGRNKDQGYSFRGIEHITAAAQKLCAKHGVVFVPQVTDWTSEQITINNKPWSDQRLQVTYRVYGPGGLEDFIEAHVVGIGRDNSDKGANKAMSQAFKYALMQVLCIADPKDDGDQATHEADARPRQEQRPKVVQFNDQPQTAPVEEQSTSWVEPDPGVKYASSRQVNQIKEAAKRLPEEQRADLVEWGKGNATVYGVELLRDGKIVATQEAAENVLTSLNALLATGVAEPVELVAGVATGGFGAPF